MGEQYIGKLMRVFFNDESEAIGTLDRVTPETQQLTFTSCVTLEYKQNCFETKYVRYVT